MILVLRIINELLSTQDNNLFSQLQTTFQQLCRLSNGNQDRVQMRARLQQIIADYDEVDEDDYFFALITSGFVLVSIDPLGSWLLLEPTSQLNLLISPLHPISTFYNCEELERIAKLFVLFKKGNQFVFCFLGEIPNHGLFYNTHIMVGGFDLAPMLWNRGMWSNNPDFSGLNPLGGSRNGLGCIFISLRHLQFQTFEGLRGAEMALLADSVNLDKGLLQSAAVDGLGAEMSLLSGKNAIASEKLSLMSKCLQLC